jgi:hypothetical protein
MDKDIRREPTEPGRGTGGRLTIPARAPRRLCDAVECAHELLAIAAREPYSPLADYELQSHVTGALREFAQACGEVDETDVEAQHDLATALRRYHDLEMRFLNRSALYRHLADKPFGHAGDFLTTEAIYANRCGRGIAGYVDRWLQALDAAGAVRDRKQRFVRQVQKAVAEAPLTPLRVLDVGSGSCVPVLAALEAGCDDARFTCLDADAHALARAQHLLEAAGWDERVTLVQRGIGRLARGGAADELGSFDLVWCGCPFDVVGSGGRPLVSVPAVLGSLLDLLHDGGRLVFCSPTPALKEREFLSVCLGWPLACRDEDDFAALAAPSRNGGTRVEISVEMQGPLGYATLRRRPRS